MSATDLFPKVGEDREAAQTPPPSPVDPKPVLAPFRATALRMALRDVRANPRASWLLVVLVTLPVMVATAIGLGATAIPRGDESATVLMGGADGRLDSGLRGFRAQMDRWAEDPELRPEPGTDHVVTDIALAAGDGEASTVLQAGIDVLAAAGADRVAAAVGWSWNDLTAADLDSQLLAGTWVLREGRLATAVGEATVSRRQAAALGVGVGDELRMADTPLTIVGIVDSAAQTSRRWTVVPLAMADELTASSGNAFRGHGEVELSWFVDVEEPGGLAGLAELDRSADLGGQVWVEGTVEGSEIGHSWIARSRGGFGGFDDGGFLQTPAGIAAIVATLSLAGAGLVAAAVWQTRVRRRLRTLGLLLVNGASDRQVRLAVTSEALAVGAVGAVLGTALGAALALGLADRVLTATGGEAPLGVRATVGTLLLPGLLGLGGSLLAAWWPARRATRVTAQQALAGRVPNDGLSPTTLGAAVVALVGSFVGLGALAAGNTSISDLQVLVGALLMFVALCSGAVVVLPVVRLVGERLSAVGSVSRYALRDAARQQGRTGAAIAVVAAVLVLPVAFGLSHSRNGDSLGELLGLDDEPALAPLGGEARTMMVAWPATLRPADQVDPFAGVTDRLRDAGFDRVTVTGATTVEALGRDDLPTWFASGVVVADDTLRAMLNDDERAALDADRILMPSWACDELRFANPEFAEAVAAQGVDDAVRIPTDEEVLGDVACSPTLDGIGTSAVSPQRARGVAVEDVLVGSAPLVVDDVWTLLHDGRVEGSATIVGGDFRDGGWVEPIWPLLVAQGVAGLFALVIISLTLMLTATETDRDLDVLFAVGARPRLRPQVLARQAWLVTTLGALLAGGLAVGGVLAGLYTLQGRRVGWVSVITIVVVGILLPLVVAGAVRLLSRRGRAAPTVRLT